MLHGMAAAQALSLAAVTVLTVGVLAAPDVRRCTCVWLPDNCHALATADAVFEATVESIAVEPDRMLRVATLTDLGAWRGRPERTVSTALGEAACGYTFLAGRRYLVVAQRQPDGRLHVSRCGLTQPLAGAGEYVAYGRDLQGPGTNTRVWGRVSRATRWANFEREYAPVSGARVTVSGPEGRSAVTDADGRYAFTRLRHGVYTINADVSETRLPLGRTRAIDFSLDAARSHACAALDFIAPIDSAISGEVVDATGAPAAGVFVSLRLGDQTDFSRGEAGAGHTTLADGRYHFEDLPPGRYSVGIDIDRDGGRFTPFVSVRAATRSGDTTIRLELGDHVDLTRIVARRR
jgi:hypothetical protein